MIQTKLTVTENIHLTADVCRMVLAGDTSEGTIVRNCKA